MQQRDGHLIFSPSDLNAFLECEHLTRLELEVTRGLRSRPAVDNPQARLIQAKGEEHERRYLDALRADGKRVVTIDRGGGGAGGGGWELERAASDTLAAMRSGADVVFQAVLLGEGWRGFADFLERVETPSDLGSWSYEVADT
ncbi:MAG: hypothetical protein H0V40_03790 [Actinobacteria bacterium]|nr:hypothetical protein [Actinomycetota bacterium]